MEPYFQHDMVTIYNKDSRDLSEIPDESIQCVVTSPPYWGLRDYGVPRQLGLEPTPEEYVEQILKIFKEVWRVLRKEGTLWLNIGDGYYGSGQGFGDTKATNKNHTGSRMRRKPQWATSNLKPKDLIGMPWHTAFALQSEGWYLRSDIIWSKPNPMPESVRDRPTRAHEYLFLLSKSRQYYYDADAIREPYTDATIERLSQSSFDTQTGGPKDPLNGDRLCRKTLENLKQRVPASWANSPSYEEQDPRYPKRDKQRGHSRRHAGFNDRWDLMTKEGQQANGANKRSVWNIATQPYPKAHFATFPEDLVEPCILAGSRPGDTILDPFLGSGTTAWVAQRLGRKCIGYELNEEYCQLAIKRNQQIGMILTQQER